MGQRRTTPSRLLVLTIATNTHSSTTSMASWTRIARKQSGGLECSAPPRTLVTAVAQHTYAGQPDTPAPTNAAPHTPMAFVSLLELDQKTPQLSHHTSTDLRADDNWQLDGVRRRMQDNS